jgi:hypothetical protein
VNAKRLIHVGLFLICAGIGGCYAQTAVCASHSGSLYCLPTRVVGNPSGISNNPFTPWSPAYSAVGSQLTLLPLPSPASGISLVFDTSLGVVTRKTQSLGPLFAERAETVGRHKIFLELDYQRFEFSSIDNTNLKHIPIVFEACDQPFTQNGTFCPGNFTVAATDNRLDLKINQVTASATFGLTKNLDISILIPIINTTEGYDLNSVNTIQGSSGVFKPGSVSSGASGIGDLTFRGKGTLYQTEHFGIAAGTDIRFPTGDELNFLGSGAWGVRPFLVASYQWRISPHANVAYQWNGNSVLGNPNAGSAGQAGKQLPGSLQYSLGVDLAASKKVTIAADFLSFRLFNALRLSQVNPFGYPSVSPTRNDFTTSDGTIGVKVNPVTNLILNANVDFKLDHNGLRHKPAPLLGASYTF